MARRRNEGWDRYGRYERDYDRYMDEMRYGRRGWRGPERDFREDYGGGYGGEYGRDYRQDYGWNMGEDYRPTFGGENFGGEGGPVNWMPAERPRQQGSFAGRGSRNYKRTDDRILEDVNEQLWRHPMIDAGDIDVTCTNAEITLTGTVDSREMKRMAEDIADSVWGVKDVHNQIRVKQWDKKNVRGDEAA